MLSIFLWKKDQSGNVVDPRLNQWITTGGCDLPDARLTGEIPTDFKCGSKFVKWGVSSRWMTGGISALFQVFGGSQQRSHAPSGCVFEKEMQSVLEIL